MKNKFLMVLCILVLLVSMIAVSAAAEGELTYDKLPEDLSGMEILENCTMYIDLNGMDIESVTVNAGATLYVKDSATDDYTIEDNDGYGKIISISGDGKVVAADGYTKITEDDGVSFHAVDLELKTLTLRTSDVGMYYKSNFVGDEVVARNVISYGVALSTAEVPTTENLDTSCLYSSFTGFTAGANGNDNDATSTVLKNIMKSDNSYMKNKVNASTSVYGRSYIHTEDGYTFGSCVSYSLRDALGAVVGQLWSDLESEDKTAVVDMFIQYKSIVCKWNIPNIRAEVNGIAQ